MSCSLLFGRRPSMPSESRSSWKNHFLFNHHGRTRRRRPPTRMGHLLVWRPVGGLAGSLAPRQMYPTASQCIHCCCWEGKRPRFFLFSLSLSLSSVFLVSRPSLKRIRETKQTHKHVHTVHTRNPVIKISGADFLKPRRKKEKRKKRKAQTAAASALPTFSLSPYHHHRHLLTGCLYDTLKRLFYALTSP